MANDVDVAMRYERRLRIAIVSQYFWPEVFPINAMAEALAERGHTVTVLTGLPNYPGGRIIKGYGFGGPWRERHGEIDIRRLPLLPRGKDSKLRLAANYASFGAISFAMSPVVLRNGYDVVLANQASPLLGVAGALSHSWLFGTPLVTWVQDLWPESLKIAGMNSRLLWSSMHRLMAATYRNSRIVLVQSRAFAEHAESYGVDPMSIRYVPNWADKKFAPLDPEQYADQDQELPRGFRVVVAGNMGEAQDFDTLIEAAKLLKGHETIRICIIGDGRMRDRIVGQIAEHRLDPILTYVGYRAPATMPAYFAAADVLLLMLRNNPTMAKTLPSRLQAYLACGRPVLSGTGGEANRIVAEAGAGLAVPPQSPAELSQAMIDLAAMSRERLKEIGNAALTCSRTEFDSELIVSRAEACLYEAAGMRTVPA